ncbi:MAG: peptidase MA family metallohydrolase [Candidatus Omnitrophica bacterium]|nr:peptidase MA family metallohydrolase [Candidatus Omnitrophota bacterium]
MRWIGLCFIILSFPFLAFAGEKTWQVVKSTHFNVFYKNAPQNELNALVQKAEECYDSIAEDFGFNRFDFWTWDNRAKIYLFDNQSDYQQATQSFDWSGGQVKISAKLIQSYAGAPGFLQSILPHELAHIIFVEMVGLNNPAVPLWLHEGVASYREKNISSVKALLADKIRQGGFLSLDALNKFDARSADSETVRLFYAESYSIVKYFIMEFGRDAFVTFCRNLRDNRNLMVALSRAYSFKDFNDFEASWKSYILK